MHSLFFPGSKGLPPSWLKRTSLAARNSERNERWLQELLFENSDLIPMNEINPGISGFVPICRELTIPKSGGSVYLDIFGVTSEGKLVLIECKLWRNPEARREVIGQILEYASLVRKWTYGDLSARVRAITKSEATNPIFEAVVKHYPDLNEGRFVDQVSASLHSGDFVLIIAGDGIRSDIHAIADHLNQSSGLAARMALVEFQLWENDQGDLVVIPSIPLRTEVVQHRIFVTDDGTPLSIETASTANDDTETIIDPKRSEAREVERAFWQTFIDQVKFNHPDQPKPRHGSFGWVRMPMPEPANWMTAFRSNIGRGGLFMRFRGDEGAAAYAEIAAAKSQLETDLGMTFDLEVNSEQPFEGTVSFDYEGSPYEDENFRAWLLTAANKITSTFRPFLSQLSAD